MMLPPVLLKTAAACRRAYLYFIIWSTLHVNQNLSDVKILLYQFSNAAVNFKTQIYFFFL